MSETQTQTLAAWLLERIDDAETAARESLDTGYQPPPHSADDHPEYIPDFYEEPTRQHRAEVAHIIVECEAKRRIVDYITDEPGCPHPWVSEDGKFKRMLGGWCFACDDFLKILALPYADRPGFREEWRP